MDWFLPKKVHLKLLEVTIVVDVIFIVNVVVLVLIEVYLMLLETNIVVVFYFVVDNVVVAFLLVVADLIVLNCGQYAFLLEAAFEFVDGWGGCAQSFSCKTSNYS